MYTYVPALSVEQNFFGMLSEYTGFTITSADVTVSNVSVVPNQADPSLTQATLTAKPGSVVVKGTVDITYRRVHAHRISAQSGHTKAIPMPNTFTWAVLMERFALAFNINLTTADFVPIDVSTLGFGLTNPPTFIPTSNNLMLYGSETVQLLHGG